MSYRFITKSIASRPTLPKSANRQRATMQTPQGLDAQHGASCFPWTRVG